MEKDVIISIRGKQTPPQGETDVIELVTAGKLSDHDGECITLSYQESEATGLNGTMTTIQVEPDRVTLQRVGTVNSQMIFEEGKKHLSVYDTPYGALAVGINTRKMRSNMKQSGGDILIRYALEVEHGAVGHNEFHIRVRESAPWAMPQ